MINGNFFSDKTLLISFDVTSKTSSIPSMYFANGNVFSRSKRSLKFLTVWILRFLKSKLDLDLAATKIAFAPREAPLVPAPSSELLKINCMLDFINAFLRLVQR